MTMKCSEHTWHYQMIKYLGWRWKMVHNLYKSDFIPKRKSSLSISKHLLKSPISFLSVQHLFTIMLAQKPIFSFCYPSLSHISVFMLWKRENNWPHSLAQDSHITQAWHMTQDSPIKPMDISPRGFPWIYEEKEALPLLPEGIM